MNCPHCGKNVNTPATPSVNFDDARRYDARRDVLIRYSRLFGNGALRFVFECCGLQRLPGCSEAQVCNLVNMCRYMAALSGESLDNY